ncbi:MAG: bifunctional nuclease family protein [Bacteroidales bacterium]|jgi:bifunctional DNase/RNase|nr:bifunctional nuclease family protein [Bacteroidales bacterium]
MTHEDDEKIELTVLKIKDTHPSKEACLLVLKEKDGDRGLLVWIGTHEAMSICMALAGEKASRPSPYDIFKYLADRCGCLFSHVNIYSFSDGIYYTRISINKIDASSFEIETRLSDAIILALLYQAPVYMPKVLFDHLGISLPKETYDIDAELSVTPSLEKPNTLGDVYIEQQLSEMGIFELEEFLSHAIESENFELADIIQNELNRRK